jgi:hypothetical protein
MPKTYIKVCIPGGKRYHALMHGMISNRNFKTAMQAEEYASILKYRYQKLKMAEVAIKKHESNGNL